MYNKRIATNTAILISSIAFLAGATAVENNEDFIAEVTSQVNTITIADDSLTPGV